MAVAVVAACLFSPREDAAQDRPDAGGRATCPPGRVRISVGNRHRGAGPTTVVVSGTLLEPTCPSEVPHAASYTRTLTIPASCSGSCSCGAGQLCRCDPRGVPHCEYTVSNLSAGEWLHRIEAAATGQRQFRHALVMGDRASPAHVSWTAYASVLTVSSDRDDGRPGTLRQAIATASGARGRSPTLIQFDHGRFAGSPITIRLTDPSQLRVSKETVIDGTDSGGNPSALSPFATRSYPTIIELDPADPAIANAATIRFTSAGSGVRGIYLRRVLGADRLLPGRDQDLVAFGAGARRGFVEACRLDGGSAHRVMQHCPANTPTAATNPAQGKDCIDVEGTGSTAALEAVVISQSELRHCYDRAVKSQNAATIVRDSWVHNNSRGGLFAQSRNGKLHAVRNLVEANGKNCPSATRCRGGRRDGMSCCPSGVSGSACATAPVLPGACPGSDDPGCGTGTCVPVDAVADVSDDACGVSATRPAAAQLSAEAGGGTDLRLQGNVVRNGLRNGVFFRNDSSGSSQDDFICGMQFGIETTTGAGRAARIVGRGVASVLNRNAGVLLNRDGAQIANVTFGDAGVHPRQGTQNAFSNNGGGATAANFSLGAGAPSRTAEHNQWQHGGTGATCRASDVRAYDVTPNHAELVVSPCQAYRAPDGGTAVSQVWPKAARAGAIVHIAGHGFNAIEGYAENDGPGGATTCMALAAGNACGPIPRGTCVEFERPDGGWSPATAILAVTPTHLVVESPIDCSTPGRVRVRRKLADGRDGTFTSQAALFCRNE
jgi:hypothetical protein